MCEGFVRVKGLPSRQGKEDSKGEPGRGARCGGRKQRGKRAEGSGAKVAAGAQDGKRVALASVVRLLCCLCCLALQQGEMGEGHA